MKGPRLFSIVIKRLFAYWYVLDTTIDQNKRESIKTLSQEAYVRQKVGLSELKVTNCSEHLLLL